MVSSKAIGSSSGHSTLMEVSLLGLITRSMVICSQVRTKQLPMAVQCKHRPLFLHMDDGSKDSEGVAHGPRVLVLISLGPEPGAVEVVITSQARGGRRHQPYLNNSTHRSPLGHWGHICFSDSVLISGLCCHTRQGAGGICRWGSTSVLRGHFQLRGRRVGSQDQHLQEAVLV